MSISNGGKTIHGYSQSVSMTFLQSKSKISFQSTQDNFLIVQLSLHICSISANCQLVSLIVLFWLFTTTSFSNNLIMSLSICTASSALELVVLYNSNNACSESDSKAVIGKKTYLLSLEKISKTDIAGIINTHSDVAIWKRLLVTSTCQ